MKICVAQIKPGKGDIAKNLEIHKKWINRAITGKADLIVFPELSLTGYEPELAKELAIDNQDSGLNVFQKISDKNKISIFVGAPTKAQSGILISMIVFQPNRPRGTYSKQKIHADEKPFFIEGNEQLIFEIANEKIAPAICYESLLPQHSEKAVKLGAEIYISSVAKSEDGIRKAHEYFSIIAKKYAMPVLMSNSIGFCDNFQSKGQSAIWNKNGKRLAKLPVDKEGILIYDTESENVRWEEETNL